MDKIKLFFFAALVVVVSCAKEAGSQEESEIVSSVEMVFTASRDAEVQTRTSRLENGDLWWSPADEIKIFNGTFASGKFISQNSEMAATATFRGSLDAATGTIESGSGSVGFMALYPYDENATCDGSSITFTLPSVQTGADDPFGNGTFPAVAQSNDLNLAFYNVCGGVKFSVAKSGILSVTFKSNGDEPIAGKIRVYFNEEGVPAFDVVDGVTEVVVNAPGSEGFEVGKDYYAILLPSSLSTGFSMVYNRDFQEAKFVTSNQIQVSRSRFGILNQLDNNLEYKPVEGNIVFADEKVKAKLIAAFDTNGDGELSYGEAANATSEKLKDAFGSIKSYKSFDEFKYFTHIEDLPPSMFEGWNLFSIELPYTLLSISDYAFKDCARLKSINLPNGINYIGYGAFSGCTSLKQIRIPDQVHFLGSDSSVGTSPRDNEKKTGVFRDCSSLEEVILPEELKIIGTWTFSNCEKLSIISIPMSVTRWGAEVFLNCSNLETEMYIETKYVPYGFLRGCSKIKAIHLSDKVKVICGAAFMDSGLTAIEIPESVTEIGSSAFSECRSIESIVIPESVSTIGSYAFESSALKSVILPESIHSISPYMFKSCYQLTSICIPDSVTTISDCAFNNCSSLQSITLPSSVVSIGNYAFSGCGNVELRLYVYAETPPMAGCAFYTTRPSKIYVPKESIELYKQANEWSDYADIIQALPD